ncbi:hypothetical protein KSP40_PGU002583 [Platanthera guangdongensis]|uniref:CN hydrolase domain-containing protein n=1 Tax=Platanthera guangdongensis TaxID=2320717 RepID=A0ABR2MI48_9ASPA
METTLSTSAEAPKKRCSISAMSKTGYSRTQNRSRRWNQMSIPSTRAKLLDGSGSSAINEIKATHRQRKRKVKTGALTGLGRKSVVVEDSPVGLLGLTVCYDLRFPELYQLLRFEHNAQVLLVPSAFTKVTGKAHWEILLRARAIETQCFVSF